MYSNESEDNVDGNCWFSRNHNAAVEKLEADRASELAGAAAQPTSRSRADFEHLLVEIRGGKSVENLEKILPIALKDEELMKTCQNLASADDGKLLADHCGGSFVSSSGGAVKSLSSIYIYSQLCLQVWSVEEQVASLTTPTINWIAKVIKLGEALVAASSSVQREEESRVPPHAILALFAALGLFPDGNKKEGKWALVLNNGGGGKSAPSGSGPSIRGMVEKLLSLAHVQLNQFLAKVQSNPSDVVQAAKIIEMFVRLLNALHSSPGIQSSVLRATIPVLSNVVLGVKGTADDSTTTRARLGEVLLLVFSGTSSSFDPWKVGALIQAVSWTLGEEAFQRQSVVHFAAKSAPSAETVASCTKWFTKQFAAVSKQQVAIIEKARNELPVTIPCAPDVPSSPKTAPEEPEAASPTSPLPDSKVSVAAVPKTADSCVRELLSNHPYAFFSTMIACLCTKNPTRYANNVVSVGLTTHLYTKIQQPAYKKDMFLIDSLFYSRMSSALNLVAASVPGLVGSTNSCSSRSYSEFPPAPTNGGGDDGGASSSSSPSVYHRVLWSVFENVLLVDMVDNSYLVELLLYGLHLRNRKVAVTLPESSNNFFTAFFEERFHVQDKLFSLFQARGVTNRPWAAVGIFLPLLCFNGTDTCFFSAITKKVDALALGSTTAVTSQFAELTVVTNPVHSASGDPTQLTEENRRAQKALLATPGLPSIVASLGGMLSEYWNRDDEMLVRGTPQSIISLAQVVFNGFLQLMPTDADFAAKVQAECRKLMGSSLSTRYPAIHYALSNLEETEAFTIPEDDDAEVPKEGEAGGDQKEEEEAEIKRKKALLHPLIRHFWAHGPSDAAEVNIALVECTKANSPVQGFFKSVESRLGSLNKGGAEKRAKFSSTLRQIVSTLVVKVEDKKSSSELVSVATQLAQAIVHRSHLGYTESQYCTEYIRALLEADYIHVYQTLGTLVTMLRGAIPLNPTMTAKVQLDLYVGLYKDLVKPFLTYGEARNEDSPGFKKRMKSMNRFFLDNQSRYRNKHAWWEYWTVEAANIVTDCLKTNPPLGVTAKTALGSIIGTLSRAAKSLTVIEEKQWAKKEKEIPWVKTLLALNLEPYDKLHGVLEGFSCFVDGKEPLVLRGNRLIAPRGADVGAKRDRIEAVATDRRDDRDHRDEGRFDRGRRDDRREDNRDRYPRDNYDDYYGDNYSIDSRRRDYSPVRGSDNRRGDDRRSGREDYDRRPLRTRSPRRTTSPLACDRRGGGGRSPQVPGTPTESPHRARKALSLPRVSDLPDTRGDRRGGQNKISASAGSRRGDEGGRRDDRGAGSARRPRSLSPPRKNQRTEDRGSDTKAGEGSVKPVSGGRKDNTGGRLGPKKVDNGGVDAERGKRDRDVGSPPREQKQRSGGGGGRQGGRGGRNDRR